jgi:lipopolysaccharide/colanic/teichoic acid biosynthesis glycosyltransferase
MGKRLFDFAAAFTALLLLSPWLLVIALAIKLAMPGPVFYSGERVGLGGKIFRMHKFRSMMVGADQMGGACVSEGDPRVTRLGRLLRKSKLDELPQLWNVLTGEMSLVGPRPEVEEYVRTYSPEEGLILTVRPGITDWASIWDHDEAAALAQSDNPERDYRERILPQKKRLQLEYVRQRSLWSDVAILFTTFRVLLFRPALSSSAEMPSSRQAENTLHDC